MLSFHFCCCDKTSWKKQKQLWREKSLFQFALPGFRQGGTSNSYYIHRLPCLLPSSISGPLPREWCRAATSVNSLIQPPFSGMPTGQANVHSASLRLSSQEPTGVPGTIKAKHHRLHTNEAPYENLNTCINWEKIFTTKKTKKSRIF